MRIFKPWNGILAVKSMGIRFFCLAPKTEVPVSVRGNLYH